MLDEESFKVSRKRSVGRSTRMTKGTNVADKTCIDSDDDDMEFEDAEEEENEDMLNHNLSVFMIDPPKKKK